jgi:hypothetical protein
MNPLEGSIKKLRFSLFASIAPTFYGCIDLACEIPRKHQNRQMPLGGLFSPIYMILKRSKEFLEEFLKDS